LLFRDELPFMTCSLKYRAGIEISRSAGLLVNDGEVTFTICKERTAIFFTSPAARKLRSIIHPKPALPGSTASVHGNKKGGSAGLQCTV